jgi:AcrR family transcriptional regulator
MAFNQMAQKRRYELKKRAEALEETRRRITEATVELHRTVGPASTTVSEVARKAGVQRLTVYNHFPDEATLFAACSAHWRALHPSPDPSNWLSVDDVGERLRVGLEELYAWFRETDPMTANVLRDSEVLPDLRPIIERGLLAYLERVRSVLTKSFRVRGRRKEYVDSAARVVTDVNTWQALADLGDRKAADLAAGFIELAAEG